MTKPFNKLGSFAKYVILTTAFMIGGKQNVLIALLNKTVLLSFFRMLGGRHLVNMFA